LGYNTTMNSAQIYNKLDKNSVCFMQFEKLDGTIRNMICTIDLEMIPKNKHPKGVMNYDDTHQVRVFDIVAQDWRSMIVDNVIDITPYGAKVAVDLVP